MTHDASRDRHRRWFRFRQNHRGSGDPTTRWSGPDCLHPARLVLQRSDRPATAQRAEVNFDHPNSLETELLTPTCEQLKAGHSHRSSNLRFLHPQPHRRNLHRQPRGVIIVEGILIFVEAALRALFDVKIFVDTDADIRLIRRLQRDITERGRTVESVIKQYQSTVRPMHLEFVEPSKRYADVIIPEGGFNTAALDMVVARIESLLS